MIPAAKMVRRWVGLIYARMSKHYCWMPFLAAFVVALVGCTHKEQTTNNAATSATEASTGAAPVPAAASTGFVTFQFTDVAITTTAAPLLRLGFTMKNLSKDPLLCDPTEFSVQLSDGSTLAADTSAENICDPDTIDPGSEGKGVMFFNLKNSYSGPVTLLMTVSGQTVGRGTTQVH